MERTKHARVRKKFSENTTCHGLAQIYISSVRPQRVFWILLCSTVFVVLITQVVFIFLEYFEYQTTTAISERYTDKLDFPAVTVCNFNHFFGIETEEEMDAVNVLSEANFGLEDNRTLNRSKVEYFKSVYSGSLREYNVQKGWQLNDETLIWCFVGGEHCSPANFTSIITTMGKCWTFDNNKPTIRAGNKFGLSMAFNVMQDNYTEHELYGNWEAGLRVQVHPRFEVPAVDELGLAVGTGQQAFIGMHKKEIRSMFQQWGQCDPDNEDLDYFDKYTMSNCFRECLRNVVEEFCGCRLYYFNENELPECGPVQTIGCISFVVNPAQSVLTSEACDCQPACNITEYQTTISYATLLNSVTEAKLEKRWNLTRISQNLVGVNVFYDRMSVSMQVESKSKTWVDLLSDLGGQLGLWMGISVVTMFELTQFLIASCMVWGSRGKKNKDEQLEDGSELRPPQDSRTDKLDHASV